MEERWLRVRTEEVDVPVEAADGSIVFSSVQSAIPGAHGLYYRDNGVKKALKYDSLTGKVSMPACGWDAYPVYVEIAHAHGCKSKGHLANYEAATKTFEQSVNMVHRLLTGATRPATRRAPAAKVPQTTAEDTKPGANVDVAQISAAEHENRVNQEVDRMQEYKMQKLIEENAHLRNKLNECRVAMENFDRQIRAKNEELRSLNAMFVQSGSVLESIDREKALLEANLREYKTWLLEANHRIKGLELENEELALECKQRCNSIDDQLYSTAAIPTRSVYTQKGRPLSPTSFFNTHSAQLAAKFPPADKDAKPLDSTEKLRRLKEHFTLRPTRREIYHHCWTPPETAPAPEARAEKPSPTKDSVSISETTESTLPVDDDKTIEEKVKRLEAVTSSMQKQNSEIQKSQIRIKKRVKDVLGKIGPTPGSQEEGAAGSPAHSDSSETTPRGEGKEEPLKVAPIATIKQENLTAADWNADNVEMSGKFCVISGTPEIDKSRLNLVILNQTIEPSEEHRRVWFEIDAPDAKNVYLAGSFLSWEYALLCERRPDTNTVGAWLDLPPGKYEFRFLVDGEWRTVDTYESELNVHGTRNNWRLVE
uniref:5'-AMP-activated protein kinase subunit beta-1 n=1 Tax=Steinernema glaseri TaxID=37863 RepID=A0A1I8AMH5_9BILA